MRTSLALMLALAAILTTHLAAAGPYLDDPVPDDGVEDYSEGNLERLLQGAQQKRSSFIYLFRRACIRRGGTCDHRPKDCCYNSSCRCNLWGANCRCQRMGLFQKWGK
nr:agatoxin-like peptide transcript a [Locusta migratoria]